jgi:type II secretion system protein C
MNSILSIVERLRAIAGRIGLLGVKPRTLALVLIAATALYASADLFQKITKVAAPVVEKKSAADAAGRAKVFEKKPRTAYQVIMARNLFGSTDQESAGIGGGSAGTVFAFDNVEQTTLQLDLLGTIAGEGDYSRAVIDERGAKKPRVYKIGDQVGGATIARIMRTSVLLRVEGREEILKMKVTKAGPADRSAPRALLPKAAPMLPPPGGLPGAAGNFRNVITQAGVRPHFEGGKMSGYYIGRIDAGSFLQRFGLQSGDIVEGINDLTFTKPDDIKQLQNMKAAPGSKSTLKVKRNGKQITLNVD